MRAVLLEEAVTLKRLGLAAAGCDAREIDGLLPAFSLIVTFAGVLIVGASLT